MGELYSKFPELEEKVKEEKESALAFSKLF